MEDNLNIIENGRRPQYFWKWKTTSIFLKIEDDLDIFENGIWSNIFQMQDDLIFFQMKNDLIFFQIDDNLNLIQMEYDLIFLQMEDNLKRKQCNLKTIKILLVPMGVLAHGSALNPLLGAPSTLAEFFGRTCLRGGRVSECSLV